MTLGNNGKIIYFNKQAIEGIALPEQFTFPFFYKPHKLSKIAAAELQQYLETQNDFDHNFGLDNSKEGNAIGKMFGVLVVQDAEGNIGYLSAFSGKLAGSNHHHKFVPPVFDMLAEGSFFLKGQEIINRTNARIEALEGDEFYLRLKENQTKLKLDCEANVKALKTELKENKAKRKALRVAQQSVLDADAYKNFEADLIKQSLHDKHRLALLLQSNEGLLLNTANEVKSFEDKIEFLKNERKERSGALQQQLFEQYSFLNKAGQAKSLHDIFSVTAFQKPPSAAGECATPKLLQYAFLNGYRPLAMAEFWWGAAPKSEVRQHKQFYPACNGKCKPILGHMLEGMEVDENPLLHNNVQGINLTIVYQDDYFVVVNKPAELRSVPGVYIEDSVYSRLKVMLGNTEPLIIHRLDMGTSGLLVVAKTKEAHKFIQAQFLKRTVKKRYTALLSKVLNDDEGEIDLPLRGDPENRPRQLVCFKYGKRSLTKWKVGLRTLTTTKVHFWPLTGRTHQLRMHSAHELGLNAPIVGDDLYGTSSQRLHLQASYLEFLHPHTSQVMTFELEEEF
ncbi:RluA family pseudouridine synthase [uncultured Mucilaginibacter sp.]|uniref:RluA family pseudouridine synthase n=1 Tax=uncultured Mucilaginibacter sp. TaxID=797541 RepID=UPI0025EF2BD0|nr:RluA family pseudouridine synthase [uncultured Mucilaginibacter sp.]